MIRGCHRQLRVGFGGAYGLDFPAVLTMAAAYGLSPGWIAPMLPAVEAHLLGWIKQASDDAGEG